LEGERLVMSSWHADEFSTWLLDLDIVNRTDSTTVTRSDTSRVTGPDKTIVHGDFGNRVCDKPFAAKCGLLLYLTGLLFAVICEAALLR
jgi:hypothetical protein